MFIVMFDRYKKSFPAKLSLYVISFITILSFVLVGVFYHYSTETLSQEAEDKIEHGSSGKFARECLVEQGGKDS